MARSHVFVTMGNLLHLRCDAWLLPTSAGKYVVGYWRGDEGVGDGRIEVRDVDFGTPHRLASEVVNAPSLAIPIATAVPEYGVRNDRDVDHVRAAVEQFVVEGARAVRATRASGDNSRILLGMPSFATGAGGGGHRRGELLEAILKTVTRAARASGVDVALVLLDARSHAHAQRIRRNLPGVWSALTPVQRSQAERLAARAREGRLVPFMGAGVSVSAGAPSWAGLLEALAARLEMDVDERRALLRPTRSMLDQAAILRARFDEQSESIGVTFADAVVEAVRLTRYGLAPALLASLGAAQAITLNYDTLFELASNDAGFDLRVIPSPEPSTATRWLLKLHGSTTDPESIVLTRDDYLGFNAHRNALSAIVKANLMTHHLMFVGFGLTDDHFHEIVHDVRRAMPGAQRMDATALTLREDPLDAELWSGSLELVPMGAARGSVGASARTLEIFLDMLLAYATDGHGYLLDPDFTSALTDDELELVERLRGLEATPARLRSVPAWRDVNELLTSLGQGR